MNEIAQAIKNNLRLFAYWWAVAFGVLFFASYDSYTHDLFYRCDSAWFFMCGKAWMNGLVPYVDFADCKGPFLWLIYGIGYLIDNDSYIGMFWIETIFYAVTLFYAYKSARIWLSLHKSAIAAALLPLALFCPVIHTEMRAEDFCHPFMMIAIYYTLEFLYGDKKLSKKASWVFGLCFCACAMIKWSVAVVNIILYLVYVWNLRDKRNALASSLARFIGGVLIVALPFIVYLHINHATENFIITYFIKAYAAKSPTSIAATLNEYFLEEIPGLLLFKEPLISLFAYMLFAGSIIFAFQQKHHRFAPIIICLWQLAIMARLDFYFYYVNVATLMLLLFIAFFHKVKSAIPNFLHKHTFAIIVIVMPFVVGLENGEFWRRHFLCNDPASQKVYWDMAYKMSVVEQPTLMNAFYEIGVSTPVDGLPACTYWSFIQGRPDTREIRRQCVEKGVPQFIMIHNSETNVEFKQLVIDSGYILSYSAKTPLGTVGTINYVTQELYRRADVPDVAIPDDFKITVWDVLLKRNPIKGR